MYFLTFYDNFYKSVITYSAKTKQEIIDKLNKIELDSNIKDIRAFEGKEIVLPSEFYKPADYIINGKKYSRFDMIDKAKEVLKQKTDITDEELDSNNKLLLSLWKMGWFPEKLLAEK